MIYQNPAGISILRSELDRLVGPRLSNASYRGAIDRLNHLFAANIHILREETHIALDRFNCHAYALGIYSIPAYAAFYERSGRYSAMAYGTFVPTLIKEEILKTTPEKAGAIIAYGSPEHVTHTGIVEEPGYLVRSKWATWEIHRHAPLSVPGMYGVPFAFFERPNPIRVFAALKKWRAAGNKSLGRIPANAAHLFRVQVDR